MDQRVSNTPTDADRYPTLDEAGKKLLMQMREHPSAPVFRNQSGNRLLAEDIAQLEDFDHGLTKPAPQTETPDWVTQLIVRAYETVPFYRTLGPAPTKLADVPPVSRADLAADIAAFVPDNVPTERMINFQTTGTTGHPFLIPSHPQVAGRYFSFHKRALQRFDIVPQSGSGEVGVMLLGHQQPCFTYISVTPMMGNSGLIKLNLHPAEWRHDTDRAAYIDAMRPEFIAGDPLSFEVLLSLDCTWKPRALMSVSMMLSDGLRLRLENRFKCPVLDLYSMNEVGPIGVYDTDVDGHVLLQDQLWIEALNVDQYASGTNTHGEITVTGGFNFCLPLLRYRTGDHGILTVSSQGEPMIKDLIGRAPVRFRATSGQWHNNIDVSHVLKHLPIAQYALHQNTDDSFLFGLSKGSKHLESEALAALKTLLGDVQIRTETIMSDNKVLQYTSDLSEGR
jgi:phenylacetate-CoA ligase